MRHCICDSQVASLPVSLSAHTLMTPLILCCNIKANSNSISFCQVAGILTESDPVGVLRVGAPSVPLPGVMKDSVDRFTITTLSSESGLFHMQSIQVQ